MSNIEKLCAHLTGLRDANDGCPWAQQQTFASILPYTIEEAYELAEAIENKEFKEIQSELGDMLYQIVFYAEMGRELGLFDFEAIAGSMLKKVEARQIPKADTAEEVLAYWNAKKREKNKGKSLLAAVAKAQASIPRAYKLQNRAAEVGFDWPDHGPVLAKLKEEIAELETAISTGDQADIKEEYGDILFCLINLGRHLNLDPDASLRAACRKFEKRFNYIETQLQAANRSLDDASLEVMEALWVEAKSQNLN